MEIFKSIGIDWKLLLAQVVNFLILFWILKKFLFGPAVKILTERRQRIEESVRQSALIKKQAEESEIAKKETLEKARKEAQDVLAETRKNAADLQKEMITKTEHEMKAMREKTSAEMEAEKQKIMLDAKKELGGIAILAAEKIIEKNLNAETENKIIQKNIQDLENENFA